MSRLKDLQGERFGMLKVLQRDVSKTDRVWWICKCDCGAQKSVRSNHLLRGAVVSCGCRWKTSGPTHPAWKGFGEISGAYWNRLLRQATGITRISGKPKTKKFELTIEQAWKLFLDQDQRCALSGVELQFGDLKQKEVTASLDRIDSKKGYAPGNVQWVHKIVNMMKGSLSDIEFVAWCRAVAGHHL